MRPHPAAHPHKPITRNYPTPAVCDPSPYGFDCQYEQNPQFIRTTSTSLAKALERWKDKHVRLRIANYVKFKDEFGKSQQPNKKMFEKMAQKFNLHSDLMVTANQCLRK